MFNLPAETFWLFIPWPFIWMAIGLFMYFKLKKEDRYEEEIENNK
ncbi:hypothetical protein [Oceanobacillus sp. CF4.6]